MGGDFQSFLCALYNQIISIHTTRVGGDALLALFAKFYLISIHTTRVGGDLGDSKIH